MEKNLLILLPPGNFSNEQFSDIRRTLTEKGGITKVVSTSNEEVIGQSGARVMVDVSPANINLEDYDGVIIIGASGISDLLKEPEILRIVKDFYSHDKLVAAIDLGVELLAKAGILQGKQVAVSENGKDYIKSFGAVHADEEVVVEGNLVTSSGKGGSLKFVEAISEVLGL